MGKKDLKRKVETEKLKYNPLLDIFDVEDYYKNEEVRNRWDSLDFDSYIKCVYEQYCQAIQQGELPTEWIEDKGVGISNYSFNEWLSLVEKNLVKQKELMSSAVISGEIPDRNAYNELEYCRRKCLEYLSKYDRLTPEGQNKVLGLRE